MPQHIPELPDDSLERFKRNYLETPMTCQRNDEQSAIERDFDAATMRGKGRAWVVGIAFAALALLWYGTTHAAPVSYTTKGSIVLSCDGAEVSRHTIETEMSERALKYAVDHGGKASCVAKYPDKTIAFDIPATAVPPPVVCPAKPADQTRAGTCPAGTTGTWTQTQTYASAAAPTCWTPSGYLPTSPPAGACVTPPPPALVAPTLSATQTPNVTTPANSNVTLSWTAVATATGYEIERCSGANCSNFTALATATVLAYANSNLPPGLSLSYRVRAADATRKGAYSNVVTLVTPTAPPPAATGATTLEWNPPTAYTDGSALTAVSGYRILYSTVGIAGPSLSQTLDVKQPATTTGPCTKVAGTCSLYTVTNLAPGTWAFAMQVYDSLGRYSAQSAITQKVVQ